MSSRSKVLKGTCLNPKPVLVGENRVEYLPDGIGSREELLQQAQETLRQAQKEKEAILSSALAEKERILNEARSEREEIHRRAYEEAYEQGMQKGLREGTQQGKQEILTAQVPLGERLRSIVGAAEESFARVCAECEDEMIDLIACMAEKVIHQEIDRSSDIVLNVIRETIARSADRREVLLRLHPDDVEIVREHQEALSAEFTEMRTLQLEADSRVSRGGCLLETSTGCVDGRLEAQLSEIHKALQSQPSGNSTDA